MTKKNILGTMLMSGAVLMGLALANPQGKVDAASDVVDTDMTVYTYNAGQGPVKVYDGNGNYLHTIAENTQVKMTGMGVVNGQLMDRIGNDEWVVASNTSPVSHGSSQATTQPTNSKPVTTPSTSNKPATEPAHNTSLANEQAMSGTIRVNYNGRGGVRLLDSKGNYQAQVVAKNSTWKVLAKGTINNRTMYRLGSEKQWIPSEYASFDTNSSAKNIQAASGVARVTYNGRGKVRLLNVNGRYMNQYVAKNSAWKVNAKGTINNQLMYRIGSNSQWIPSHFVTMEAPSAPKMSNGVAHASQGQIGLIKKLLLPGDDQVYKADNGQLLNGWKQVNGKWRYFIDGKMDKLDLVGNYIIDRFGNRYPIPNQKTGNKTADAQRVAHLIANCIGNQPGDTDLSRVAMAANYVSLFSKRDHYTMKGADYAQPYGVFISGQYSCAGSTRALGLVLNNMGFKYNHVNPNDYTHQWVQVKMDGRMGYADGQVGLAGYGNYGNAPVSYLLGFDFL